MGNLKELDSGEMTIRIAIAGATGRVGQTLSRALNKRSDFKLVSGLNTKFENRPLSEVVSGASSNAPLYTSIEKVLECDPQVLIDYSASQIVKRHILAAMDRTIPVVVGTSGLTDQDFLELENAALRAGVGILCAGNFSITAALLQKFALIAAKSIPNWEILDFGRADKRDAPSGTTRELAHLLSEVAVAQRDVPISETLGYPEARGAQLHGSLLHSLRLPGFHSGCEIVFGLPGENLHIKHSSISDEPYVEGTLIAAKKVLNHVGLVRGMNNILEL